MTLVNAISKAAEQTCFVVKETTKGTLTYPTDANKQIAVAGYVEMSQSPSYSDSEDIVNSRDVTEQFRGQTPSGNWSLPIYARPVGAGVVPMGAELFEALMGKETINNSTSVVYSQTLEKPSLSLFAIKDHTLFFASGVTVQKLGLKLSNSGGAKFELSGGLMKMGWCGRDEVKVEASSGATTIRVKDPRKYCVGGLIQNTTKSDDNSNAGYVISEINYTTGDLTVSALAMTWEVDDQIDAWLPSGGTIPGNPLTARLGSVKVDSVATKISSADINISDPVQYLEDEISTIDNPTDYLEGMRDISGSIGMYFRVDDAKYFHNAFQDDQKVPIVVQIGETPGEIVEISMPKSRLEVPKPTTNAPAVNLDIPFKSLGTSGEDSCTITFK